MKELQIVPNDKKYWEFIRTLRNDPRVKSGFIQQEEISHAAHGSYMQSNWWRFWVCLVGGVPAGYARTDKEGDISVCTHPDFQKMGVGVGLISHIKKYHPEAFARIKIDNEASKRLFEKCGFKTKYVIMEQE